MLCFSRVLFSSLTLPSPLFLCSSSYFLLPRVLCSSPYSSSSFSHPKLFPLTLLPSPPCPLFFPSPSLLPMCPPPPAPPACNEAWAAMPALRAPPPRVPGLGSPVPQKVAEGRSVRMADWFRIFFPWAALSSLFLSFLLSFFPSFCLSFFLFFPSLVGNSVTFLEDFFLISLSVWAFPSFFLHQNLQGSP